MIQTIRWWLERHTLKLLVVVALVGWGGWHCWQAKTWRGRVGVLALRADSTAAAADTSRRLGAEQLRQLGDSLAAWQLRAVQAELDVDQIDRDLEQVSRVRHALELRVVKLEARVTAPVVADPADSIRTAEFDVREPPHTSHAKVALPRPPATGSLLLQTSVDAADLGLRLGCGEPVNGIRPAQATAIGPKWLTIRHTRVDADPRVCNGERFNPGKTGGPRVSLRTAGLFGLLMLALGAAAF